MGRCLAPAHLPENFRVAVLDSVSLQISRDLGRYAEFLVFQCGRDAGKIRRKPADDAEARIECENGEARAGRNFAEIFDDLLPHERLILRLRIEKVEQQNVDGIGTSSGGKIGEDVRRHRR